MNMEIWHVTGNGFHFGRHGLEQEESGIHFPSDSLFAALVARMAELYGDDVVEAFGAPFLKGNSPFVLSSAFPRAGGVLFFPPPLRRKPLDEDDLCDPDLNEKALKKVSFVSEAAFRKLLAGDELAAVWCLADKLHDGKVLYLPEEADKLPEKIRTGEQSVWVVERRPQVTIGRAASDSMLYHTGRTAFNDNCGLWFAVRWIDKSDEVAAQIEDAFLELGDAGLGGERSRGYGACKIEPNGSLELPSPSRETPWMTLSRYLPRSQAETESMTDDRAAYAIETVQGWVTSPQSAAQRRKAINILIEGSVLGPLASDTPGQMVDVRPIYPADPDPLKHPVWRNGFALAVGLKG